MKVDLPAIKRLMRDSGDLKDYLDDFLDNKCSPGDPPFLSDVIVGVKHGGVPMMQALEMRYHNDRDMPQERRFRWKLHVVRDEWGNPGLPGDIVKLRFNKPLFHIPGKPATTQEINVDKLNGDFDRKWTKTFDYKVDEKGCIACEFEHAVAFLKRWGVHSKSNAIMSQHKQEHSGGPRETAIPGERLHVWYWRYKEADAQYYQGLPKLPPRDSSEQKRGYKK